MEYIKFSKSGNAFTVTRPTKNLSTSVYFLPERSPELATAIGTMMRVMDDVQSAGNTLAGRFSEQAFDEETGALLERLGNGIKAFRLAAVERKTKTEEFRKGLLTFNKIDLEKAREIRTSIRRLPALKIFEIAAKDPEVCSAVLEMPSVLSGLTPDLLKQLEKVQLRNASYMRFLDNTKKPPELNDLLPTTGDEKKARTLADATIKKLDANDDECDLAEKTIAQLIAFYAVIMGTHNNNVAFEQIRF